jgi:hypothetical protein
LGSRGGTLGKSFDLLAIGKSLFTAKFIKLGGEEKKGPLSTKMKRRRFFELQSAPPRNIEA